MKRMDGTRRLEGKVILVLGAGTDGGGMGNGKAAALAFAREGAIVVATDRNLDAARETAALIDARGGTAHADQLDVTSWEDHQRVIAGTLERFSRIDVLHNNVGIASIGGLQAVDVDEWRRVLETNTTGAFLAAKAIVPQMLRQGGGVITNVSSIASMGVLKVPVLAYGVAKAALNFLTRSIAVEYAGRGIRANVIVPGLIDTPMVRNAPGMVRQYSDEDEMILQRHAWSPTGRMGEVSDIAEAAVFLASHAAKYINGVVLPVDGGLTCKVG